jgi:hypothetical protein
MRKSLRRGPRGHRPHSDGPEAPRQIPFGKGLRAAPVDGDRLQTQLADHMAKEVRTPADRLDQHDLPFGVGKLEDEAGHTRPAPDIEQGGGRRRKGGQQHEGLEDEVPDPRRAVAVRSQAPDTLPALQFLEIRVHLMGKSRWEL